MNYKAISAVFVVLAVILAASTGYLLASPNTITQTQTVTQTSTLSITTSSASNTAVHAGSIANTVNIAYKASLGFYLVNGSGFTLYLYTKDTPNSGLSTCYGQCATFWPPFYSPAGSLLLPPGLNASSFGTITRTDGSKQITYEGWPLYTYAPDKSAGQTTGQGQQNVWYVINFPTIKIPNTATTSTATTPGY